MISGHFLFAYLIPTSCVADTSISEMMEPHVGHSRERLAVENWNTGCSRRLLKSLSTTMQNRKSFVSVARSALIVLPYGLYGQANDRMSKPSSILLGASTITSVTSLSLSMNASMLPAGFAGLKCIPSGMFSDAPSYYLNYLIFNDQCQLDPSLGAFPTRHLAPFRPVTWRHFRRLAVCHSCLTSG